MNMRVVLIGVLATMALSSPIPADDIAPEMNLVDWDASRNGDFNHELKTNTKAKDNKWGDGLDSAEQASENAKDAVAKAAKVQDEETAEAAKKKAEAEKAAKEAAEEKQEQADEAMEEELDVMCLDDDGCDKCIKDCPDCVTSDPRFKFPKIPARPSQACMKCAHKKDAGFNPFTTKHSLLKKRKYSHCRKCSICHSLDQPKPPKCFYTCEPILRACPACFTGDGKPHYDGFSKQFDMGKPKWAESACKSCAEDASDFSDSLKKSYEQCKAEAKCIPSY